MGRHLGQVHRSKVKVTGSKNVHLDVPLTSESPSYRPAKEEAREYNWWEYNVRCFQSVCVCFCHRFLKVLLNSVSDNICSEPKLLQGCHGRGKVMEFLEF